MQEPVEHQVRHLTHVPAILKLPKILRKMLSADVNVSAADPALELSPEAFDALDVAAGRS